MKKSQKSSKHHSYGLRQELATDLDGFSAPQWRGAELLPQPGARQLLKAEALCSDVLELGSSMCATDTSARAFFGTRRTFLFQSPFELLPLAMVDLHHSHQGALIT